MTMARVHLVDPAVTRWYHCVNRCVRRAFLLGEGTANRKLWIERRLEELAQIFSISVAGFAVLDNHLHVLARLDPGVAAGWSDEEVVRRWGRLFPPRGADRQPLPVSADWVRERLVDLAWVTTARQRLASLSWFMKCLKEPLARMVNREEQTRGAFLKDLSYCLHSPRLTNWQTSGDLRSGHRVPTVIEALVA
jgi:hypothetical protein